MDDLFSKAPVKHAYFKLALPVVMGMITTMIYNLADTVFVAKTGNPRLVAGVTIGAPLFTFCSPCPTFSGWAAVQLFHAYWVKESSSWLSVLAVSVCMAVLSPACF